MPRSFSVSISAGFLFGLIFDFLALILVAFLVWTICCFLSKLSTVPTMSFKCFLGLFLIGLACEEGIIVFLVLFIPAHNMLHCLIFAIRNCSIFGSSTSPFLSFSFKTSIAPSYSDCGREFNKWVMNISSSILCPLFAISVHLFSKKANQSIVFCLVFSNL